MENTIEIIMDDLMISFNVDYGIQNNKLPSENELATKYNVPRATIRKCFDKLEEMGYIYSKQGKGRYVKRKYSEIELRLKSNESFTEKMRGKYSYTIYNTGCQLIEYDEDIYKGLNSEKNEAVFKIGILRIVEEEPIAIHFSYIPEKIFKNISSEGDKIQSLYQYFDDNGIKEIESSQSIMRIVYPNKEQRRLLKCKTLTPLIRLRTIKKCKNTNRIVEFSEVIYRADCFEYII